MSESRDVKAAREAWEKASENARKAASSGDPDKFAAALQLVQYAAKKYREVREAN